MTQVQPYPEATRRYDSIYDELSLLNEGQRWWVDGAVPGAIGFALGILTLVASLRNILGRRIAFDPKSRSVLIGRNGVFRFVEEHRLPLHDIINVYVSQSLSKKSRRLLYGVALDSRSAGTIRLTGVWMTEGRNSKEKLVTRIKEILPRPPEPRHPEM